MRWVITSTMAVYYQLTRTPEIYNLTLEVHRCSANSMILSTLIIKIKDSIPSKLSKVALVEALMSLPQSWTLHCLSKTYQWLRSRLVRLKVQAGTTMVSIRVRNQPEAIIELPVLAIMLSKEVTLRVKPRKVKEWVLEVICLSKPLNLWSIINQHLAIFSNNLFSCWCPIRISKRVTAILQVYPRQSGTCSLKVE